MKTIFLLSFFILLKSFSLTLEYDYLPYKELIDKINKFDEKINLKIKTSYPTKENIKLLTTIKNLNHLTLITTYMPSKKEINLLQTLKVSQDLILDKIFPDSISVKLLNESHFQKITLLWDRFLEEENVSDFSKFTIPFHLIFTGKKLALPVHISILNELPDFYEIYFEVDLLPGPGYKEMFDKLKHNKTFILKYDLPFGIDPETMNEYLNTKIEIQSYNFITKSDVDIINRFHIPVTLKFLEFTQLDKNSISLINSIKVDSINLKNWGSMDLYNQYKDQVFTDSLSPIEISIWGF